MSSSPAGHPIRVLFSPRAVFEAIRERTRWEWALALLILVAVSVVASQLAFERMDLEEFTRAQLENSGREMTEDQIEQALAIQEKFGAVGVWLQNLVMFPLGYLLAAFMLWIGFKVVGGEFRFVTSLTVMLLALMPQAVKALLSIPVVLAQGEISTAAAQTRGLVASNLGWIAPDGIGKVGASLLGSLDLFTFWTLFLLVLGGAITARVGRGPAVGVVGALWVLWVGVKVGLLSLGG